MEEKKIERDIETTLAKQAALRHRYLVEPKVRFDDFGGIDDVIEDIQRLDLYLKLGVDAPRGFLLHGPPGVGKSLLVEALANDLQIAYLRCGATEIVAGISGESEEKIRQLFALAKELKPCLLFIDEIDAITPKRENAAREMERRIVTQVITCMDELSASDGSGRGVMVIGATNRPDSLDPALRRAGRFDREIALGIPDEKCRLEIIRVLSRNIKVDSNFDFESLAHRTPGYVGADLKSLIREAAILALERFMNPSISSMTIEQIDETNFQIEFCDFDGALKRVQPSSKREGFATVPDVTWNDVGALSAIRQELQLSILAPVRFTRDVEKLGLSLSVGILLCGPPGCGKTLLAKAIANESGINFISVKGPELLNMYVGESERAVRAVFNRARCSKPCVIFFDEIDALCPRRTDSSDSSNVTSRVVNQLLTEMDGLESRDCFLLAATNRPDILDPAILRPGRFDKILHVGFPLAEDRFEILCTLTKEQNHRSLRTLTSNNWPVIQD
ncbi:nuclear valosin-containing protein-like protein [Euroglyphus maynei]|uniref:Nuclear valosin-containing protein-like protein n=1 Tax=Euroglyphus maynei TaxID=6958 RepID=A0A1Y3BBN2_EURMA|nr:nuclear valosin-containing protein-like protein [Euroglyphus maynei]